MVLIRPEVRENSTGDDGQDAAVKVKTPKRVLHFCDGILEEYSTDEEDADAQKSQTLVDPATLTWGPWFWYKAWAAGASTLSIIDTMGEYLASLFGITTPRYYFELEEYKKREAEKQKTQEEQRGWSEPSGAAVCLPLKDISTTQPQPVQV